MEHSNKANSPRSSRICTISALQNGGKIHRHSTAYHPSRTTQAVNTMQRPLSKGCQQFLSVCREQYFVTALETNEKRHSLGQFPSRKEQMNLYVGLHGMDIKETVHWRYNIENCKRQYDIDLYPLVKDGLTDIFIAGHRQHNLNIAAQTLQGTRSFIPTFDYLARERIIPIAVSYKHGADEQLSLQRLFDGICALDYFLEPGTRYVLWIDLVPSRGLIKRRQRQDASWLKRGLLPYQLFVVLCLDNSTSGRAREDYVNSFWLNIEGVLATLGSGMVMVGPDLKRNAVASWLFEDKTSDIPIEYAQIVANDEEMQVAFRPGNTMDCDDSLKFLLQNAVKGAYDNTTARYKEDKDDLIRMANCVFHTGSGTDFGKVAYDLDYSDYDELFRTLSSDTNPESVWLPLHRSGRVFDSTMPGEHTMYPTYISSFVDPESSTCVPQWLPKHCRYFRTPSEPAGVYDIWIHFQSHGKIVAVIAMAVIACGPGDTKRATSDGRLHVKILQTKEIASKIADTRAYGVERVIDLWDCRVPILLRDVLRMLDGQALSLTGVRRFLKHSEVECPELTSFFVSEKFESKLSDNAHAVVVGTAEDVEDTSDIATIASDDVEQEDEDENDNGNRRMSPDTLGIWFKYFYRMRMIGDAGPYSDNEEEQKGESSSNAGAAGLEREQQSTDGNNNRTESTTYRFHIEVRPNEGETVNMLPSVSSRGGVSKRCYSVFESVFRRLKRLTRRGGFSARGFRS